MSSQEKWGGPHINIPGWSSASLRSFQLQNCKYLFIPWITGKDIKLNHRKNDKSTVNLLQFASTFHFSNLHEMIFLILALKVFLQIVTC